MLNDLLSDGITRLRNGWMARLSSVRLLHSKFVMSVLKVLQDEGYLERFEVVNLDDTKKHIEVFLRYHDKQPVLQEIRRISKPGCRIYSEKKLPRTRNTFGFFILSTSKGVMPSYKAKKLGIGGEILAEVY